MDKQERQKLTKNLSEILPKDLLSQDHNRFKKGIQRFAKNKAAVFGSFFLVIITLACLFGPYILPNKFDTFNYLNNNHPPTFENFHLFGTDDAGRDLLVRSLVGGRVSLLVGFLAATLSVIFGTIYGAVSGYLGGIIDSTMMRVVDIMYSIPYLIIAILIVTIFGQDITLVILTITFLSWMDVARVVRGQTLTLKSQEFIEAAHVMGASQSRIIFLHIIPNLLGIVVVYATITIPVAIIVESVLSFLGLGVVEPFTSWGLLIHDGAIAMEATPWLLLAPGALLSLTLFSANYIGDGLRDALDPRQDVKNTML